jgi:predicted porin
MKRLISLAFALVLATTGTAFADQTSDNSAKIDALQKQLDAVKAQLDQLKAAQKPAPAPAPAPPAAAASFIQKVPGDTATFLVGGERVTVYGNIDLSYDVVTKGLPNFTPPGGPADNPVGNTGYLGGISTNLSYLGVRGRHTLGPKSGLLYQLETQIDVSATPGTVNTNSNSDSIVKSALFSRNSFIGVDTPIGAFKIGKTDAPYKTSTARMNPFNGHINDYAAIMGNSGGDNRVEFGTRLDHAIWFESKSYDGLSMNMLVSPGQNRAYDNSNIPTGESSCAGGNIPGSGALPPSCNDGSWGTVYSWNMAYAKKKAFLTAAYELHKKVNRSSDLGPPDPNDVGDEQSWKGGIQWAFNNQTSVSAIYETMQRYIPGYLQFQNERSRDGFYLALTHQIDPKDSVAFGWGRANPTPGDTGQHNTGPGFNPDNMANNYGFSYRHAIDRHVSYYFDYGLTVNHKDAHYDLGAGGRGLNYDCHDAAQLAAFDATVDPPVSGNGPHCYAGNRLQGFSTGINLRF